MYTGDIVPPVQLTYDTVRESLESDLLFTTKQDEHFESLIEEWRSQDDGRAVPPEAIGLNRKRYPHH